MNIDPKGWEAAEVVTILTEVFENYADRDVTEKINKVGDLLKRNPQLCDDREVAVSLHRFKECGIDSKIKALLLDTLPGASREAPPPSEPQAGQAPLERVDRNVRTEIIDPMLTMQTLGRLAQVSKTLNAKYQPIVDKAWEKTKADITIGVDDWKKMNVEVNDAPPLPDDIDAILKADCPCFKGKKVFETSRLVLMHDGVSFNNQGARMAHLRVGEHVTVYRGPCTRIIGEIGDAEVGESYWALVTCDVIPNSRNQNYANQKKLFDKIEGYRPPTALEVIILTTMHCEKTGVRLLPCEHYTLTRTSDIVDGCPLVVGAFASFGLFVTARLNVNAADVIGVLAVRKLSRP